jgi:hypothetical protein
MSFNFIPPVYADTITGSAAWESVGCASDGAVTIGGIECIVQNLLAPLPSLIALTAVGMMIFAGIKIINAGANDKAIAAGWNTFYFAAIGLVLLSVVWFAIVLIQNYTGSNITNFGIPN